MSEHIEVQAKNRKELDKQGINEITTGLNTTMATDVECTRQSIIRQKDNLIQAAKQISALYDHKEKLKERIQQNNSQLSGIIIQTKQNISEYNELNGQLNIEKQKLYIYQLLKQFNEANKLIRDSFTNMKFKKCFDNFKLLQEISAKINLSNIMKDLQNDYISLTNICFNKFLKLTGEYIEFLNTDELLYFIEFIDILGIKASFIEKIFAFIVDDILQTNLKLKTIVKSENQKITIHQSDDLNVPSSYISFSTDLLSILLEMMKPFKLFFSTQQLEQYANKTYSNGLQLPGGDINELQEMSIKLSQVSNTPKIDLIKLVRDARMPQVLGECRKMLENGEVFGNVVQRMQKLMEGTDKEGVLRRIAVLAAVIWKEDKDKLEAALQTLITIGTREALDCLMLFDEALQQSN